MNKVQHFEIPADDVSRARTFYEKSFGWKTKDWPMPDGSPYEGLYTGPMDENNKMAETGFINGGMFQRGQQFAATSPTIAVVVEDLDMVLEKIITSGGSIVMEKKEIAGAGMYAYIKDTEGNTIGVWEDVKK